MLSRWLHRGGLGQIIAPDPTVREEEEIAERDEFTGGLWSVLAPDPKFTSPPLADPQAPSHRHFSTQTSSSHHESTNFNSFSTPTTVNMTASTSERYADSNFFSPERIDRGAGNEGGNANSTMASGRSSFLSPSSSHIRTEPKVERLVLSAAKDLTQSMLSPMHVWEDNKNFMSYCASTTQLNEKKLKKVKKMLQKDPSLANARASNMGNLVPNGFTPLHAAALVGNYDVALILIDFTVEEKCDEGDISGEDVLGDGKVRIVHPVNLDARDVQGRTALHIASLYGHVKVVQLLKEKMKERLGVEPLGEHAPTDLTGRTPLGWAATSRETKARENIIQLRNELFSPGDKSVYGEKTPAFMRVGSCRRFGTNHVVGKGPMDLIYGFSDMPGHRIDMEDAICHAFPLVPPSKCDSIGFFGVFDGHGDGGISSKFIGENIIPYFTSTKEWNDYNGDVNKLAESLTSVCLSADAELKKELSKGNSVRRGGSTGVMAIISSEFIMIGNVGDSRCILVQTSEQNPSETAYSQETQLVRDFEKLSMKNQVGEEAEETEEKKFNRNVVSSNIFVKALSTDHKPNLKEEKSRIEKAGMVVAEETFTIDGVTNTISKICKSESDRIAVSRAFGDFDYKENNELSELEQAIIAVPEITIHRRDYARDMYIILACDGIYDVMSNDDVGEFVVNKVNEFSYRRDDTSAVLAEVGDELLKECLNLGSSDNMSVLIVALPTSICESDDSTTRALHFADI
jgi:serine/threonine protein phosphatase PrpC